IYSRTSCATEYSALRCGRFRNIVVHRYGAIDDSLAFSILTERIGDFALFRQEVERFLQSPEARGST
ncbi:MAG TPA: DUF86 domain-containing protein, partial [Methanoculleus sp.]|nr:DUF86 domain-containing protein [Methanoculleus sp.]